MLPLLLLAAAAAASEPDDTVDVAAVRDKLEVLSDGKGHYVALIPFGSSLDDHVYWGDGKTFWALRIGSAGASGRESFDRSFWEPRVTARWKASVSLRDGKYTVQCEDRTTGLEPLPRARAQALLGAARFRKPRWKRQAYAFARDEAGRYFYVDRPREPAGNKAFRLFIGPKGALKPARMTNVVSDTQGDVFATRDGELRLVLGKKEYAWVARRKKTPLIPLAPDENHVLIYSDLGVYAGELLGTPCDEL